jgi:hypothetical protein
MLKCKGCAITILTEDQYHLIKTTEHNHAAETSWVKVIKTINILKERSQKTNDNPVQVIQAIASQEICPYLPSHDALQQTINKFDILIIQ